MNLGKPMYCTGLRLNGYSGINKMCGLQSYLQYFKCIATEFFYCLNVSWPGLNFYFNVCEVL